MTTKPPRPEKAYFGKQDFKKRQKIAETQREESELAEKSRLKQLHWRRCGNCGGELESIPFKGETVFRCPGCGAALLLKDTLKQLCGEESRFFDSLLDLFKF